MLRKLLPYGTILATTGSKLLGFQAITAITNNSILPILNSSIGSGLNELAIGSGNASGPVIPYTTTDSLSVAAYEVGPPLVGQHTSVASDGNFTLYLDNNYIPNVYFFASGANVNANTPIASTGGSFKVTLSNNSAVFFTSLDNGVTWNIDATVSLNGLTISNTTTPFSAGAPFIKGLVFQKNGVNASVIDFSKQTAGATTFADSVAGTWTLSGGAAITAPFVADSYTRPAAMVRNALASSFYTNTFQLQNQSTSAISNFGKTIGFTIPQGSIPSGQTINITETDGTTAVPFRILKTKRWSDNSLWRVVVDIRPSETFAAMGNSGDTHSYKINALNGTITPATGGVTIANIAAQNCYVQLDGSWSFNSDVYRMTFADVIANCAGPSSVGTGVLFTTTAAASTTLQFSALTSSVTDELSQIQTFAVSVGMHIFGTGVPSVYSGATGAGKGNNVRVPSGVVVTAINTTNNTITVSHAVNVSANTPISFAYPIQGYEVRKPGLEFYFWSYAKRVSDSAFDRWLRIDAYVQAWSATGAWSIKCGVENSNVYGAHPTGSVGNLLTPPSNNYGNRSPRYWFRMTLWNGTTQLGHDWGGPNDPNGITKTSANVSNGDMDYWNDSFYQALRPVGTNSVIPAPLVVDTVYCHLDNALLPTANSNYGANNITLTSSGTGTFLLYPVCAVGAGQKVLGLDATGLPTWWQGTSAITSHPLINFIPDVVELSTKTALIPSYALEQPTYLRNCLQLADRGLSYHLDNFQVGGIHTWGYTLNNYGDDPGDERVGFLTNLTANWFFQPKDPYVSRMLRTETGKFADYIFNWRSEETGLPPVPNMGPARTTSSNYTALGTSNCNIQMVVPDLSIAQSGGWSTFSDYNDGVNMSYYSGYGPVTDNSHHPIPMFLQACMDDDECSLDQFLMVANTLIMGNTTYARNWINPQTGEQLSGVVVNINNQLRGIGWQLRIFSQLEQLMHDGHKFQPVIRDMLDDSAKYLPQCFIDNPSQNGGSGFVTLGIFNGSSYNTPGDTYVGAKLAGEHAFFDYIAAFCFGMASWLDKYQQRRPGFAHFIDHFHRHFIIDMFDDANNGSDFLVDMYNVPCGDTSGQPFTSVTELYQQVWGQHGIPWKQPIGICGDYNDLLAYATSGNTPVTTSSGRIPTSSDTSGVNGISSYPFATGYSGVYRACALAVWANAGHADAERLWVHYKTRLETLPCRGITWAQPNNVHYDINTPQNYVAWAVKPVTQPIGISDKS